MIEIDDKIVSADLLREYFACDLAACKGICCVEGNAGAPLEMDEVDTLGALARRYGTTVSKLCSLNGIKSTTILRLGRKLRVR